MQLSGLAIGLGVALGTVTACLAQDLRGRIEGGPDGQVTVSYAARPDVCGSGTGLLRIGGGLGESSWIWTQNDGPVGQACEGGPIRLLLTRAEGRISSIRLGIGTVRWPAGTTDLGAVPAGAAASYLLDLAARSDGRVGREALTAAVVADSAETWRGLLAMAGSRTLSRGLRESATSWLGREVSAMPGLPRELTTGLAAIARDQESPGSVRSRAVSALGRGDGVGVTELLTLARAEDPIVAKAAMGALGRSGDPRARETLRRAARDSSVLQPVRVEAIKALGGRDASPADLAALRGLWPTLSDGDLRRTVLQMVAETGGGENARWLLGVARDEAVSVQIRSQAVRGAEQAGAGSSELIRLYDESADRPVKEAVLEALIRIGDRAGTDKLAKVAQSDTDPQLRRSAISRLARAGDRRALGMIEGMVEKR